MPKTQIVVIQTLVEYSQLVADAAYQPLANGPVTCRVVTTLPNGDVMMNRTHTFPDDSDLLAEAATRGDTRWTPQDIISLLGI
jgi:hypothetical protein